MKVLKPALVLMIITFVCAALLIVTYNFTYVDTSNILTDDLKTACEDTLGKTEKYTIISTKAELPSEVKKVIKSDSKNGIAFEIVTKGYSKDGIDVLVSVDKEGLVIGVVPITISETTGIGTKVKTDEVFLTQFVGKSKMLTTVKTANSDDEITAITGATKSSNGVTDAVNIALESFELVKEEIFDEQ